MKRFQKTHTKEAIDQDKIGQDQLLPDNSIEKQLATIVHVSHNTQLKGILKTAIVDVGMKFGHLPFYFRSAEIYTSNKTFSRFRPCY